MTRKNVVLAGSAIVAVFALIACTVNLPTYPAPSGDQTQIVMIGGSAVSPSATAAAPGVITRVKVGFFGGVCSGNVPIAPGQTDLKVGCIGTMTATPKVLNVDGSERDATDLEHGSDAAVEWISDIGADKLSCRTSGANGFNRDCTAVGAGPWRQCAQVKGVVGCTGGTVTN